MNRKLRLLCQAPSTPKKLNSELGLHRATSRPISQRAELYTLLTRKVGCFACARRVPV